MAVSRRIYASLLIERFPDEQYWPRTNLTKSLWIHMALLKLCLYVTEPIKEYIFLFIPIQYTLQKRKFRPAVNSVYLQRIPAMRLISQHFESDFVKLRARGEIIESSGP